MLYCVILGGTNIALPGTFDYFRFFLPFCMLIYTAISARYDTPKCVVPMSTTNATSLVNKLKVFLPKMAKANVILQGQKPDDYILDNNMKLATDQNNGNGNNDSDSDSDSNSDSDASNDVGTIQLTYELGDFEGSTLAKLEEEEEEEKKKEDNDDNDNDNDNDDIEDEDEDEKENQSDLKKRALLIESHDDSGPSPKRKPLIQEL